MSPKEISKATGLDPKNVRSAVREMKDDGLLVQPGYGQYDLPGRGNGFDLEDNGKDIAGHDRNETVAIPLLSSSASASTQGIWETQIRSYMTVDRRVIQTEEGADPDRMAVIRVTGDSMAGTMRAGDRVMIVRHSDGEPIVEGVVYVWRSQHRGVIVKRAHWVDDEHLELLSDNERYSPITIHIEEAKQWECVGRVVRVMRAV